MKRVKDKDLHPVICSEDGNEHGDMYDQRANFGSDDIDYPAKPILDCIFKSLDLSPTYIHKTIAPPAPSKIPSATPNAFSLV